MSDANDDKSKKPAEAAKPEAKEEEQTPPPEPGEFGQRLEKDGINPTTF